jgi:hypothetical protein
MTYDTTAEQRSSFITYAEQRIEKEFETNLRLEKEAGTTDFLPPPSKYSSSSWDDEERIEVIGIIDKMRISQGISLSAACDANLIHPSSYHKWKKRFNLNNK